MNIPRSLALAALFVAIVAPADAQSFGDYLSHYAVGAGYQRLTIDEYALFNRERVPNRRKTYQIEAAALSIGWHFPIVMIDDRMSVGAVIGASALFGPNYENHETYTVYEQDGFTLLSVEAPLYATFKYGADATLPPKSQFGGGVGIGYQPSFLPSSELSYGTVMMMGELALAHDRGVVKIRGSMPVVAPELRPGVEISTYNISLLLIH